MNLYRIFPIWGSGNNVTVGEQLGFNEIQSSGHEKAVVLINSATVDTCTGSAQNQSN